MPRKWPIRARSLSIGQYKTGETYGAIYPKGNANNATIDKIIQSMIDDGTMAKLGAKYLAAAWGKDPATFPTSIRDDTRPSPHAAERAHRSS